jgi:hypothetical protein
MWTGYSGPELAWLKAINGPPLISESLVPMVIVKANSCQGRGLVGVQGKLGARRQFLKGYQDFLPEVLFFSFGSLCYITNRNQFVTSSPAEPHFLQKTPVAPCISSYFLP